MNFCIYHGKPLVTEHTSGKQICITCYLAKCREARYGPPTPKRQREYYGRRPRSDRGKKHGKGAG